MLVNKLIEIIPDPRNGKKHYQSFIKKRNTKSVNESEIITYQLKAFDIVFVKSVITEHPKASQKLSKTIRQTEKVGSNSSLYSDTTKKWKFFKRKNVKRTKRKHAFKGFSSTYNVEIFNSFNPELQLKNTDSAIKSKLVELSTQLKGFRFMTTLVFNKTESEDKTKSDNFYSSWKAEIIINESNIDDVFQSIYTTIVTNIQKSLGKGSG